MDKELYQFVTGTLIGFNTVVLLALFYYVYGINEVVGKSSVRIENHSFQIAKIEDKMEKLEDSLRTTQIEIAELKALCERWMKNGRSQKTK